jgi:hypothetical protein
MTSIPTPRSLPQILGGMVDDYLSRLDTSGIAPGLSTLKPGSSILALLEAVAQSQVRGSQDLLNLLNADDIDRATGIRLQRIGAKERVYQVGAVKSKGVVTLLDSRYTRRGSQVYSGMPAPIPGSTTVYINDGTGFPATGNVYLGRGTSRLEGPLPYTAIASIGGNYWSISLATATSQYHNHNETVVLGQGGDRLVEAGQVVGTPQGNSATSILFETTQQATILDGEVSIENISVVSMVAGVIGNVAAGAITYVRSPAFAGLAVINPGPITNGLEIEDDDHYRERIKSIRSNRAKATEGALLGRAYGVQAPDEAAIVTSATMVVRPNSTTTMYVDDGAGYEEKDSGVDQEVLIDSANGGEDIFVLAKGHPVARAMLKTTGLAPFRLSDGAILSIKVGQTVSIHVFNDVDFGSISNATAYEVVASINAHPGLLFRARTTEGGEGVSIFANRDVNESLEVLGVTGTDAAIALGLTTGRVDTLRLYLNDKLLSKDGSVATLKTSPQIQWGAIRDGATLSLDVDGTGSKQYVFLDSDFAIANYPTTLETNSLAAWAVVMNHKIPGITAVVVDDTLEITSNLGRSLRASLSIDSSSSVVSGGMFSPGGLVSVGQDSHYTLDRNRGIVELSNSLAAGDRLTAGSRSTRAYVEGAAISTATTVAAAHLWFVVDGTPEILSTGLQATHAVDITNPHSGSVHRLTAKLISTGAPAYPFVSLAEGDWLIVRDSTVLGSYRLGLDALGCCRVSGVDPSGGWFEIDCGGGSSGSSLGVVDTYLAFVFARTTAEPQEITFPATTTYTAYDISNTINSVLEGAAAVVYENHVRVTTNTYGDSGSIGLVALDGAADVLGFVPEISLNDSPHAACVLSGNTEEGTPPVFADATVATIVDPLNFTVSRIAGLGNPRRGSIPGLRWMRPLAIPKTAEPRTERYSTAAGHVDEISSIPLTGVSVGVDSIFSTTSLGDRFSCSNRFHLGPESNLGVVVDNDPLGQGYNISMFRRLVPDPTVPYGSAMKFFDSDHVIGGSPATLVQSFGTSFDFSNFVLYGHPRGVTHPSTANKSVLWRARDFRNGEMGAVSYALPALPGAPVDVTWTEPAHDVSIILSSGARRSPVLGTSDKVRVVNATTSSVLIHGYKGLTLSKAGTAVTCTPTLPSGVTTLGYNSSDTIYLTSSDPNFPSGPKTLTVAGATSIQWDEAPSASIGATVIPTATLAWTGSSPDLSASVQVGDVLSIDNIYSFDRRGFEITAVGFGYVVVGLSTLAVLAGDSNFHLCTTVDDIQFYPLDQSPSGTGSTPITTSWLVGQVNALQDSPISGTLGGDGSGIQNHAGVDDVSEATADLIDGIVHISSSSNDGTNYTLVTKYSVSGSTVDWAHEEFRLVPTTLKNVVDFINAPIVTGLSLGGASILAAAQGERLQLTSGTIGSGSAIQVTGGSANRITMAQQGSGATSLDTLMVSVNDSTDLSTLTQGSWVSVDAQKPMQKNRGWSSITATISSERLTLSSALWDYSTGFTGLVFPIERSYFERCGGFTAISLPTALAFAPPSGDYITVPASSGGWVDGPDIGGTAVFGAAFVTMLDGSVLQIGGSLSTFPPVLDIAITAQVRKFDPILRTWGTFSPLPQPLSFASACVSPEGHVLVCGGIEPNGTPRVSRATYIYWASGPSVGTWTTEPLMNTARVYHSVTALPVSSAVVVVGGQSTSGTALATCEVWGGSSWTLQPSTLVRSRWGHQAINYGSSNVSDGKIVVMGGWVGGGSATSSVECIQDPQTMVWSAAGSLTITRGGLRAVVMPSMKALVVGGTPVAEEYDLSLLISTAVAPMSLERYDPCVGLLSDGKVLVSGGTTSGGTALLATEIFDPVSKTWSWVGSSKVAHRDAPLIVSSGVVYGVGSVTSGGSASSLTDELDLTLPGPSSANVGTFRIIAATDQTVWIENQNSVDESAYLGGILLRRYSSAIEGDTLQVSTRALGLPNQGQWTVGAIDLNNRYVCGVLGLTDCSPTALGADTALFQIVSGVLPRVVMRIDDIIQSPSYPGVVDLFLRSGNYPTEVSYLALLDRVGESGGCLVNALDRFDFSTGIVVGGDAYRYNTGLIGEVNRVLYGDPQHHNTYPGYIAAGQVINLEASLVRRIQVSLAIRIKPGSNPQKRVQNAVAKVINTAGPKPIPLSDIIEAASGIDGVISVVLIHPVCDTMHDTIPVQPYETPKVLDLDQDIRVTILGQ